MIARITGTLAALESGSALLDLGSGIAHEVLVPAYLFDRLQRSGSDRSGETLTLHTLEYLESQNQGASFIPRLIGFAAPGEREFFELLTTVKGLGNKRALRAMASEPALIARAIHDRDTRALQRLPEIGPKLAELIVHELKNKAEKFTRAGDAVQSAPAAPAAIEPKPRQARAAARADTTPSPVAATTPKSVAAPSPPPPIRQTVEALILLGEAPVEAERLVARAIDLARAAGHQPPADTAALIAAVYATR